ncbi:MAG: hypothetical protein RMJ86_09355 [Anaerolineae bacterium]|nr:hypothetical protein [Thermoflexales bacterium]MDW8054740.1 hypothetical protein [Anaerolineae bacterium]MDW8292551.1 hypothetical protein [Anaerolineae bacterium]
MQQEFLCANIGPRERQKRLAAGVVGVVAALAVAGYLIGSNAPWWAGIATLPFFLSGALGLFQWQHRTCIANVRRGVRNMDQGDEPITDAQLRHALEREAQKVQAKSLLAGAISMLLVMLVLAL